MHSFIIVHDNEETMHKFIIDSLFHPHYYIINITNVFQMQNMTVIPRASNFVKKIFIKKYIELRN